MGYFSQRKKQERENIFLQLMTVLLGIVSFGLFLPTAALPQIIADYLFQIYIINLFLMFFAFYIGRWGYGLFFTLFIIIGYVHISSAANMFTNIEVNDEHHITLTYSLHRPLDVKASGMVILRSGHINLGSGLQSNFMTFEKNLHVFTIIEVDLDKADAKERRRAFRHLREFVRMQDDPVIIVGNFGEPAWTSPMKKLLADTQLQVKNHLLFNDKHHKWNPLAAPKYYVLAFRNVGINSLQVEMDSKYPYPVVISELGFY